VIESAALPGVLAANEAAARQLLDDVAPVDESLVSSWTAPDQAFEHLRLAKITKYGPEAYVILNFVRAHGSSGPRPAVGRLTYDVSHRVAVVTASASVRSPLETVHHTIPIVGSLRVPHFAYGDAREALAAWSLAEDGTIPPLGAGFQFLGCVDGILYARTVSDRLDPIALRDTLEVLLRLAARRWVRPTPRERQRRHDAHVRRARRQILGCAIFLLALAAGAAWLLLRR
jgi:hypothetical protein